MQAEAPGTYTHSLMVAMLSEAAAKEVSADPLMCRVGGLYHDIGKLRRPHCFIENQSGHNIHDELSPQLSALIILAHVKDGLELGRALRLPQPVLDIIAQHHGTTVLSYFYNRALHGAQSAVIPAADVGTSEPLEESSIVNRPSAIAAPDITMFRYAGPRPQSKEAAIVLLADSIEASSRALPDVTPEKLHEHIRAMIATRLREGELSECELTLRDLGTIENAFTHVLRGALHQRVQYPSNDKDLERSDADWMDGARREKREGQPDRDKTPQSMAPRTDRSDRPARPENRAANEHGTNGANANGAGANGRASRRRRRRARQGDGVTNGAGNGAESLENPHEPGARSNPETNLEANLETDSATGASAAGASAENGDARERELESGGTPRAERLAPGSAVSGSAISAISAVNSAASNPAPGAYPGSAAGGDGDLANGTAASSGAPNGATRPR